MDSKQKLNVSFEIDSQKNLPEWTLLELQGTLGQMSDETLIGSFKAENSGICFLQIGHHKLEGKYKNFQNLY